MYIWVSILKIKVEHRVISINFFFTSSNPCRCWRTYINNIWRSLTSNRWHKTFAYLIRSCRQGINYLCLQLSAWYKIMNRKKYWRLISTSLPEGASSQSRFLRISCRDCARRFMYNANLMANMSTFCNAKPRFVFFSLEVENWACNEKQLFS